MEKYFKISRQIVVSFIFNALMFLTGVLRTIVLTRFLTLDEYGVFSIFFVSISFFASVFDLGFSSYIVTRLTGISERKRLRYFFSILGFSFVYLIVLASIVKLSSIDKGLLLFFGLGEYIREFNVVFIIICLGVMFRMYFSYIQSLKKMELSSAMAFFKLSGWVYILLLFLLIFKTLDLFSVFLIMLLGLIAGLIIFFVYTFRDLRKYLMLKKSTKDHYAGIIKRAMVFGLPLVPFLAGNWWIQVGNNYVLKYLTTTTTVAIYNLGYSLVALVFNAGIIISSVIYPYYSESWNKKENHHVFGNIVVKYVFMLVVPASVGLFVMRNAIITLISGQEYLGAAEIIPILILFPLFGALSMFFYQTLMLRNKTKLVGLIYLFGGVLNITLNIMIIPLLGMIGAAIVTTLTYFVVFVLTYYVAKSYIKVDWSFIRLWRILLSALIMGVVVFVMNPTSVLFKIITIVLGLIVYLVGIFVLNVLTKNELKFIRTLVIGIKKNLLGIL